MMKPNASNTTTETFKVPRNKMFSNIAMPLKTPKKDKNEMGRDVRTTYYVSHCIFNKTIITYTNVSICMCMFIDVEGNLW